MKRIGVYLSKHAIHRIHERGVADDSPERDPVKMMFAEVHDALDQGRKAKKRPRWVTLVRRRNPDEDPRVRYAWNEEESRCYVIKRARGSDLTAMTRTDEFDETWIVLTVLTPDVVDHEKGDHIRKNLEFIQRATRQGKSDRRPRVEGSER